MASSRTEAASRDTARVARAFEGAPALVQRLVAGLPYDVAEGEGAGRSGTAKRGLTTSADDAALLARARAILAEMSEQERIAVLDAHPRIGAALGNLSEASRREQGRDEDPTVLRELATLNHDYERRFGFRFVVCVAGRSKAEIVPVLRTRVARSREQELATGTAEFLEIARRRLAE